MKAFEIWVGIILMIMLVTLFIFVKTIIMIKEELIEILNRQTKNKNITHWKRHSDNHWELYRPCIDGLSPTLDLSIEGIVKIEYPTLYSDDNETDEVNYVEFLKAL